MKKYAFVMVFILVFLIVYGFVNDNGKLSLEDDLLAETGTKEPAAQSTPTNDSSDSTDYLSVDKIAFADKPADLTELLQAFMSCQDERRQVKIGRFRVEEALHKELNSQDTQKEYEALLSLMVSHEFLSLPKAFELANLHPMPMCEQK